MVSEKIKDDKKYFVCDLCGLAYNDKETAEKCEAWCKEHPGSCNPDVVKEAVKIE